MTFIIEVENTINPKKYIGKLDNTNPESKVQLNSKSITQLIN